MSTELSLAKTLLKFVPEMATKPGQYIYCTDDTRAFYDIRTNIRIEVDLVIVEVISVDDITEKVDKQVYYMEPARRFVVYDEPNDQFKTLNNSDEADAVYGSYGLVPFTMRNQITGMNLAPRTLASAVYTSYGESVEAILANSYRLGHKCANITAPYDGYDLMEVPYPFDDYAQPGNVTEVYLDGLLLTEGVDYEINDSILRIIDPSKVHEGDLITFVFTYNATDVPITPQRQMVIEGGYITRSSIPTSKLEKVSDSITEPLSDTVASSKAVNDVYTTLSERIAELEELYKGNYYATAGGNADVIEVSIPGYTETNGTTINVKLTQNLNNGAAIKVNELNNKYIYVNGTQTTGIYQAGQFITLVYDAAEDRYNVKLYTDYKIGTYYYHTRAVGGEAYISFAIPKYIPGVTTLRVYQNNLRLFDTINYTVKDNAIRLLDYTANPGDIFSFEVDVVEQLV